MNAVRLFSLLIYTFGVFVYGAILALWIAETGRVGWAGRQSDGTGGPRRYGAMNGVLLALSFLWFVLNVTTLVLSMTPQGRILQIDLAIVFVAFAFPPVIMHLAWAEASCHSDRPMSRAWWLALWPMYLACLAIPTWTVHLFFSNPLDGHASGIANQVLSTGLVVVFILAACYSMALLSYRRRHQPLASPDRRVRRPMLILFACMIAVFVLVYVIEMLSADTRTTTAVAGDLVELVAKSLPLVFVFVGTYYENRFQFFDIFVKRGTGFAMAIAVLTIWFAIMLPLIAPIATTWAAPWIFAIALVPAVVVIPWLYVIVSRVLDRRWLGRRFTPQEALSHFMATLRSATTETQLMARAQDGLKQVFGADARVTVDPALSDHQPAVQDIPVRSGENVVGHFLMGARVSDTPYFSEDLHLLTSLADVFSHVLENLRLQARKLEQEQRARELSLHASRSELKALRAQINPHFLFNALNSIAGLIHRDPGVADRTIEQLADVFRYALRGAESEWAMLDDEMEFVRSYLEVERARFGDRLRTDVRMDDSVRGARIPTMIVQTLVENAVKHGVSAVPGPASVVVEAHAAGERLTVSVTDTGAGFDMANRPSLPGPRGGYGLLNVRQRLDGYFGADAALSVVRRDDTTIVSVTLPLVRQEPRAPAAREVAR